MSSTPTTLVSVAVVLTVLVLGRFVLQRLAARSDRGYQQWRERWH
jgi:hypothetical protein